jgi:hypothetical protein
LSANAFPMPTAWLPCPGKVNATAIDPAVVNARGFARPSPRRQALRGANACIPTAHHYNRAV